MARQRRQQGAVRRLPRPLRVALRVGQQQLAVGRERYCRDTVAVASQQPPLSPGLIRIILQAVVERLFGGSFERQ